MPIKKTADKIPAVFEIKIFGYKMEVIQVSAIPDQPEFYQDRLRYLY
ncbi:hypothetical protein BH10BAC5_BH10BAC5_19300 [soil metagenome]